MLHKIPMVHLKVPTLYCATKGISLREGRLLVNEATLVNVLTRVKPRYLQAKVDVMTGTERRHGDPAY